MATFDWFRWHHGTVNDPKFRAIACKSGRPLPEVLAVWAAMLECASANATERRGTLANWSDEDAAFGLDMSTADVAAIRDAMQGKTLDGDRVSGWDRRQPKREDGAAERAKAWREKKKAEKAGEAGQKRTQANADERTGTKPNAREEKSREDSSVPVGTGVVAPEEDMKARLFGPVLGWLMERSGRNQASVRSQIGRWCKLYGDGAVLAAAQRAYTACRDGPPIEAISWMEAALKRDAKNGKRPDAGERIARDAEDIDRYFGVEPGGAVAGDGEQGFDFDGDFLRVA